MKTLNLDISDEVLRNAEAYAKKKKSSLKNLVENYVKALAREAESHAQEEIIEIPEEVKKHAGSLKAPKNFDYKKDLADELSKKYL